jgi:hypothetical protein
MQYFDCTTSRKQSSMEIRSRWEFDINTEGTEISCEYVYWIEWIQDRVQRCVCVCV